MRRAAPLRQGTSRNTYRAHSSACREPESPAASPRQPSETHCTAGVWDAALEHPGWSREHHDTLVFLAATERSGRPWTLLGLL